MLFFATLYCPRAPITKNQSKKGAGIARDSNCLHNKPKPASALVIDATGPLRARALCFRGKD